jgi:hypothetical protein
MVIEIHTHANHIGGDVIAEAESSLFRFHTLLPSMSRCTVHFRQEPEGQMDKPFECRIDADIFGNAFSITRNAASYGKALHSTLKSMERKVQEIVVRDRQPPDEALSTVET